MDAPVELRYIFEKVMSGERKLPLAALLEEVPRYNGIPFKPPEFNLGGSRVDKSLKAWKQTVLHILRLMVSTIM